MTPTRPYWITRPDQIHALAAPPRQEIIDAVHAAGPATVTEVATLLGRAPDSLYYHVRILRRVGLLLAVRSRRAKRREETIYDLPGRPLMIAYDLGDPGVSRGISEAIAAMLRITERDFHRAVASREVRVTGPRRNLWGARTKGWLDGEQLAELNQHLRRINQIMQSAHQVPGRRLHALTFVISPLQPGRRARAAAKRRP